MQATEFMQTNMAVGYPITARESIINFMQHTRTYGDVHHPRRGEGTVPLWSEKLMLTKYQL
jgi:hypothetical protein